MKEKLTGLDILGHLYKIAKSCKTTTQIDNTIKWGREVLVNHDYKYHVNDFMEYAKTQRRIIELCEEYGKGQKELKFLTERHKIFADDSAYYFSSFIIKDNYTVCINLLLGMVLLRFQEEMYPLLEHRENGFKVTRYNDNVPEELKSILSVWDKESIKIETLNGLLSENQKCIFEIVLDSFYFRFYPFN